MTQNEFRKMLLYNEIKKVKARVGAAVLDGINEQADPEYIETLDEVNIHLQNAIDRISQ